jgi:hypothetical protein
MPPVGRPTRPGYQERGATRSGLQFARLNSPYQPTLRQLLDQHRSLLSFGPASADLLYSVGSNAGTLTQTTIRFRADLGREAIANGLRLEFVRLFRLRAARAASARRRADCFEVVVTFNVILSNRAGTTFSVFYGQDFSPGNRTGTSQRLRFFDRTFIVRELADLQEVPTQFDLEEVAERQKLFFEDSDLRIVKILNIVYIVYQFIPLHHSSQ